MIMRSKLVTFNIRLRSMPPADAIRLPQEDSGPSSPPPNLSNLQAEHCARDGASSVTPNSNGESKHDALPRRASPSGTRRADRFCHAAPLWALATRYGCPLTVGRPSQWPYARQRHRRRPAKPAVALLGNLTLLLGLWQLMDLVSCHVDLHSVADAIEFPIGNNNHVAAETEKATDLDPDRGDFPAGRHCHTVNGAKVGPIR